MNKITFSQALNGYLLFANARRLSHHTIRDYVTTFRKFLDDDQPIEEITSKQVESFLAAQTVSKNTLLNYHTGLSALWTWFVREDMVNEHIVQKVDRPKPEQPEIQPYTKGDP